MKKCCDIYERIFYIDDIYPDEKKTFVSFGHDAVKLFTANKRAKNHLE